MSSDRTVVTRLPLRLEVLSLAGNVSVQNSIPSNQSTARDKTVADSVSTILRIPLSPVSDVFENVKFTPQGFFRE